MKKIKTIIQSALIITLSVFLFSCGDNTEATTTKAKQSKAISSKPSNQAKQLRVLITPHAENIAYLPRNGTSTSQDLELLQAYAIKENLELKIIYVDNFSDLIPALIANKGDLIVANLTITEARKKLIDFSAPLNHIQELLVSNKKQHINKLSQLKNRTIHVRPSTSFYQTALSLQKRIPSLKIKKLPENVSPDDKIDLVQAGEIDLAIIDSNVVDIIKTYRQDFSTSDVIKVNQSIAYAIRKGQTKLKTSLDHFINDYKLRSLDHKVFIGDFDAIQKRKVIRFITRNNAASYFVYRGQLLGFEYELAKKFADRYKLRLEVSVAETQTELFEAIKHGKADIAAAFLTPLASRRKQGVEFSRSYHKAYEVVVARTTTPINTIKDLDGKKFAIRRSSSYFETLKKLHDKGAKFIVNIAPENEETQTIIAKVASGEYEITLADSHILTIEQTWLNNIESKLNLGEEIQHGWAVRNTDTKLLKAINSFIKKEYKSTFYNLTYAKYFKNKNKIIKFKDQKNDDGTLSPYDDLVKKEADKYGFNWQLIVAQMHQESRFNPKAKSWVGAKGLMQVMPRTAKHMKIKGNLQTPAIGIKAGVKYLNWLGKRFEDDLNITNKTWFSLAAYNAGTGHVRDARRLAKQLGYNPDIWFDNVEKAMLLLSQRKYAKKARHGYVRGKEPVNYVRSIRSKFRAYQAMTTKETS